MKTKLLLFVFLIPLFIFSQTQIGADIDGEAAGDRSGTSVSLSADGNTVAIGAKYNADNGSNSGQVRVYQNISGDWTQIGADIDGEAVNDESGYSVSLSSDGNILAIGIRGNDVNGNNSGQVRVYRNISGDWTQIGGDINGEAEQDVSGTSISLSADGSTVAIGAPNNDGNGNNSGQVRVYRNNSGVWTQIGTDIDGEAAGDKSGNSVSLSTDGNIIAIGARLNDGNGSNSGHVRVYQNNSGVWTQIGTDIDGEATGDYSGTSVSLSADGSILAIGANMNDDNGSNSGHVRVYQNILNSWTQLGADIDGKVTENQLGISVSLSSDGGILAIGSCANEIKRGCVGIYKYNENNTIPDWQQIGSNIVGESDGDVFGFDVKLSSNGNIIAIGAYLNDGVNGSDSGQVRVYDLSDILSVEENFITDNFTVIPNHSSSNFKVKLSNNLELKSISLYNYLGQKVMQTNKTIIYVSHLTKGLYYLQVETINGKGIKKVVVE